jgi:hypothetical protein
MTDFNIRLFMEGQSWVAHCQRPGIDLAAQGPTIAEALEALAAVWRARFRGRASVEPKP